MGATKVNLTWSLGRSDENWRVLCIFCIKIEEVMGNGGYEKKKSASVTMKKKKEWAERKTARIGRALPSGARLVHIVSMRFTYARMKWKTPPAPPDSLILSFLFEEKKIEKFGRTFEESQQKRKTM